MARRDAQEVLDDALCSDPPGGRLAARYLWIQIGVYGRPLRRFSRPGNAKWQCTCDGPAKFKSRLLGVDGTKK